MAIRIFDYFIDEETEIELADINEVWSTPDGFSYLENVDGLIYKVLTTDINKHGIYPIMEA